MECVVQCLWSTKSAKRSWPFTMPMLGTKAEEDDVALSFFFLFLFAPPLAFSCPTKQFCHELGEKGPPGVEDGLGGGPNGAG